MFNKYFWVGLTPVASMSCAMAAVDVNTSDEVSLEGVTGIGSAKARAIVREREANGPYKDADDLAARIDGLGPRSIEKLQAAALLIGGAGGPGNAGAPTSSGGAGGGAGANAAVTTPVKPAVRPTQTARK